MKLAIVGSVLLEGNQETKDLIETLLDRYRSSIVISGGARGVDQMAALAARARGILVIEHLPKFNRWKDGYRPRNLKIAQDCDRLIRIISSNTKTYGSGWTKDRAAEQGKPVEEYVIGA